MNNQDWQFQETRLRRKLIFWRIAAILFFLISLFEGTFFLAGEGGKSLQDQSFGIQRETEKRHIQYGLYTPNKPADSAHLLLVVTLKGTDMHLRYFEWDNLDYANVHNCFKPNTDQNAVTMSNYVPFDVKDSLVSVSATIKNTVYDNPMEFSVRVYNPKGKLIGGYPDTLTTMKYTFTGARNPLLINDYVKIK